jgi:hypothetical protein
MAILCGSVWVGSYRGEARDSIKAHSIPIPVTVDDVSAPWGPCCSVSMVPKMAGVGTQSGYRSMYMMTAYRSVGSQVGYLPSASGLSSSLYHCLHHDSGDVDDCCVHGTVSVRGTTKTEGPRCGPTLSSSNPGNSTGKPPPFGTSVTGSSLSLPPSRMVMRSGSWRRKDPGAQR